MHSSVPLVAMVMASACASDPAAAGAPERLSDEGLYADVAAKRLADDAIAFAPRYPLWSDGATKQRWMRLPPDTTIDTTDIDHWQLPVGTRLYKEFAVAGQRVETRVIERTSPTDVRFAVYAWLPDESDALPVPDGASDVNGTTHDIPSVEVCRFCHQSEPGITLGVSAIQLAADTPLARLPFAARLSDASDRTFAIPGDATARAALGAMHANCGHCHSDGGIAPMQHLRVLASDADRALAAIDAYATTVGVPLSSWQADGFALRIAPGDPDASPPCAPGSRACRWRCRATSAALTAWICGIRPESKRAVGMLAPLVAGIFGRRFWRSHPSWFLQPRASAALIDVDDRVVPPTGGVVTELARKALSELPWGPVFATPARRGETCQITLRTPDGKQHCVAYERGAIVGATSPLVADAVARIAVLHGFATSHQLPEMTRRIQAGPDRDEVEIVAEITGLSPDNATRLRRRVVAQRAARTFAVDAGELVVDDTITIPARHECALDVRAVMYIGARMYLSEQRVNVDLRPLGNRFVLKPEAIADLPQFGFSDAERPIIDALVAGSSVPELEARYRDIEPRTLRAVVYSLWSCACLDTAAPAATAATTTAPALSRTDTEPAFALDSDPGFALDEPDPAQTPGFSLEPAPAPVSQEPEPELELELAPPSRPTRSSPQPLVGRPTRPIGEEGFAISIRPTRNLTPPVGAPGEEIVRRTTTPKDLYAQTQAATAAPPPARTATTTGQLPGRPAQTTPPTAPRTSTTGQPYARTVSAPVQPRAITPQTAKGSDPAVGPYDQTEPLISARAPTTPFVAGPRTMTTGAPPTGPRTMSTGTPPAGPRTMTTGAPPAGPRTMTTGAPPPSSTPSSGVRAQTPSGRPVSGGGEPGGSQPIPVVRSQTPSGLRTPPSGVPVATTPAQTPSSGVRVTTPPSGVRSTTATPPVGVTTMPSGSLPRTLTPGPIADLTAPRPGGSQPLPVMSDNTNEFEARATSDEQSLAEEAFTRGSSALRREDLSEALECLSRATALNPQSIDYLAVYAWARFIAATDKQSIADDTRKILQRAIAKSKTPDVPHFYLGRVERMLGEDRRALHHFREVVELKPRHADAKAEIRMLEAKLQQAAQNTKGGGLFGLKKR